MARSRQVAGAKMTIGGIYGRARELVGDLGLYTQNYPFEWCKRANDSGARNSGPQMAIYTAIMENNPTRQQILQLLDECWQRFGRRVNPEPLLDLPCPSGFALIPTYECGPYDPRWGVSHTRNEEREVSWHEAMVMFIAGQMVTFSTYKELQWNADGTEHARKSYDGPLAA